MPDITQNPKASLSGQTGWTPQDEHMLQHKTGKEMEGIKTEEVDGKKEK